MINSQFTFLIAQESRLIVFFVEFPSRDKLTLQKCNRHFFILWEIGHKVPQKCHRYFWLDSLSGVSSKSFTWQTVDPLENKHEPPVWIGKTWLLLKLYLKKKERKANKQKNFAYFFLFIADFDWAARDFNNPDWLAAAARRREWNESPGKGHATILSIRGIKGNSI